MRRREIVTLKERVRARRAALEQRICNVEQKRKTGWRNALLTNDVDLRAEAEVLFVELKGEEEKLKEQLRQLPALGADQPSAEQIVARAMALFDDLARVTSDPVARADVSAVLKPLGFSIGLTFLEAFKNQRRVRRLASGVITFGGDRRMRQSRQTPKRGMVIK